MAKLFITREGRRFLIRDETKDMHTNFGMLKAEDIKKAALGSRIKSNTGTEFFVAEPSFIDFYRKIRRGAQIIPLKDIGLIITEAGLNKKSVIAEAGSGSGALCCFLATICKKIYSYELRQDFYEIVKSNIEMLGIKNIILSNKDAKNGFGVKDADAVILDLPDPWELIGNAKKALKHGGFLISYSPTIPQVMDFASRLDEDFIHLKTSEITEREWEISERRVRPKSQAIGHSGFITFARRL